MLERARPTRRTVVVLAVGTVAAALAGCGSPAGNDAAFARAHADPVCLLNGRRRALGGPDDTLTAERLREAYGGHAVTLPDGHHVLVEP